MKALFFSAVVALLCSNAFAQGRIVTLMVSSADGVDEIDISPFEHVQVKTFHDAFYAGCSEGFTRLQIQRGTNVFTFTGKYFDDKCSAYLSRPLLVAGPAKVRLSSWDGTPTARTFATLEISPGSYPPDKAITVAPGTGGASVNLECSTDLVNWTSATNGIYTNLPSAKFFRIRAERIP